jgi:glycosyltransferase involved in cell wall biosynthesis
MNDDLTIAIPTINSERYLDIVLEFYRDHGFPVTVFVDDGSDDNTLAVAKRSTPTVVPISNPCHFVAEGLIEQMSERCRTKWILRIDDDELPTLAMMQFVQKSMSEGRALAYGFPRNQCAVSRSGRLLRSTEISPLEHRQWRLYQPAKMNYVHGLHTPGFEVDASVRESQASSEASMIHLDWAVHSYGCRKRKIERYDAHIPNEGTRWRAFYLYEEQPVARQAFAELRLPEFGKACAAISRRFPDLCVQR